MSVTLSAPYIKSKTSVKSIMIDVIIALVPIILASTYFFGLQALIMIGTGAFTCYICELICNKLLYRNTSFDGSSLITGIILALSMPVLATVKYVIIGSIASIVIGKVLFGGIGKNLFNPSLIGRTYIVLFFPEAFKYSLDGNAGATILSTMWSGGDITTSLIGSDLYASLFIGNMGGALGETSALAILIGGCYLIYKKIIDWKIPVLIISVIGFLSLVSGYDPILQILSGSLFLGAFFMATDPVTRPITSLGRIIYSIGIGVIIFIIRVYLPLPEGVLFAIIIMNLLSKTLDKFVWSLK